MLPLEMTLHVLNYTKGLTKLNFINTCHLFNTLSDKVCFELDELLPLPFNTFIDRGTLQVLNSLKAVSIGYSNEYFSFRTLSLPPLVNDVTLILKYDCKKHTLVLPLSITHLTISLERCFNVSINNDESSCLSIKCDNLKTFKSTTEPSKLPYNLDELTMGSSVYLKKVIKGQYIVIKGYCAFNDIYKYVAHMFERSKILPHIENITNNPLMYVQ